MVFWWSEIKAYKNGQTVGGGTTTWSSYTSAGYAYGELVVGSLIDDQSSDNLAICQVDELLIWNIELEEDRIRRISEM